MSVTIQLRRDTAANWTSSNPVLHQGEVGLETDTGKAKQGDGTTAWISLGYWGPSGNGGIVFARDHGATGSSQVLSDAAMTASSKTLTSASAPFTSASVGKTVNVTGAGPSGAMLSTTIAAYTSTTTVTLTDAASTTVSSQRASIYGSDDTSAIQAAIDATPTGGMCVLDDQDGQCVYLVSSSLKLYGSDSASPVPVKLAGWGIREDLGVHLLASASFPAAPVISAATKYAPGGTATQFAYGEIENLYIDMDDVPTATGAVGIYYDRVQEVRETSIKTRGGACGRVIGWANNIRFSQPEAFNHSDSYWKWLSSYTDDAPWDTANAGNTIGPGQTYGDPVQFELIYPFNYLTSGALGITANAFITIKAGNDFQITGGHSLRTPGINAYILDGINADFSGFSAAKDLFLFADMHEIDGVYDDAGNGGGVTLNNAQTATFGDNFWCSAAPASDGAAMWALKLTNCTDISVGAGHWNGLGVLLDGVSNELNFTETRFPQSYGGYVFNSAAAGTLDSSMNSKTLPQSSIAVGSMTGTLPSSGTLMVATSSGPQAVTFTGQSTTSGVTTFTGCSAGSGTMSTGGTVVLASATNSRFAPRYYAGSITDNAETLGALVQASPQQLRGPVTVMGNATTAALQVGRAMDGKAWQVMMDTSSTGTLTFKNSEGSTKMSLSDSGVLAPSAAMAVSNGGTGATTAAAALTSLGAAAAQADPAGFTPANPAGTTSTSLVMMGLGSTCTYTPSGSGKVVVTITGYGEISTAVTFLTVGARYGLASGGVPANGDAVTGTRFGAVGDPQIRPNAVSVNNTAGFAFTALLSLTAGDDYWIDLAVATNSASDTANVTNVGVSVFELP